MTLYSQPKQKPKLSLETRLKAWDASRPDRGSRNWFPYAAAVGSALAMATNAEADGIVYSGIKNVNAVLNSPAGFISAPIGVGAGPFLAVAAFGNAGTELVELNVISSAGFFTQSGGLRKLASGAFISSGAGIFNFSDGVVAVHNNSDASFGNFSAGNSGFAGVDFKTGTVLDQKTYYGWVRLVYTGAPPNSITAIDWAWETTPGMAIQAGQTVEQSGAPEPGTAALSLLALGAAGVLALRRRIRG